MPATRPRVPLRLPRLSGPQRLLALSALAVAGALIVTLGWSAAAGSPPPEPCDIYAHAGTPCAAAYSSTRALFSAYDGALYQVRRASDGATADVRVLGRGGYAEAAAQDRFCAHTSCTVTRIYDQTRHHNDLTIEGPGGNGGQDAGVPATSLPTTAGGRRVYGLYFSAGMGYRDAHASGIPTGSQAQGLYMVTSGRHVNGSCCFDFGNAETNGDDNGAGHMDALYFGRACSLLPSNCAGTGPWVEADLEDGLYQSGVASSPAGITPAWTEPFVMAVLGNDGRSRFQLQAGSAQAGGLTTVYAGPLPGADPPPWSSLDQGYAPMHQEGAIVLGTGGDDSNAGVGTFFEGVVTSGLPSAAADAAVQANIVAARYR